MLLQNYLVIEKTDTRSQIIRKSTRCVLAALLLACLTIAAMTFTERKQLLERYKPYVQTVRDFYAVLPPGVDEYGNPLVIQELRDDTSAVTTDQLTYTTEGYYAVLKNPKGGAFVVYFTYREDSFTKTIVGLRDIFFTDPRLQVHSEQYLDLSDLQYHYRQVEREIFRGAPRDIYETCLNYYIYKNNIGSVFRKTDLDIDGELNKGNKYVSFGIVGNKSENPETGKAELSQYVVTTVEQEYAYQIQYNVEWIIKSGLVLFVVMLLFPVSQFIYYFFFYHKTSPSA